MIVKCPHCGYVEDMSEELLGQEVECPCGRKYIAGDVQVSEASFVDGQVILICPCCGAESIAPKEAANRNVRCCECNGKFRLTIADTLSDKARTLQQDNGIKTQDVMCDPKTLGQAEEKEQTKAEEIVLFNVDKFHAAFFAFLSIIIFIGGLIVGSPKLWSNIAEWSKKRNYINDVTAYNNFLEYNGFWEPLPGFLDQSKNDVEYYVLSLNDRNFTTFYLVKETFNKQYRYSGPSNWPIGDIQHILELRMRIYWYEILNDLPRNNWKSIVKKANRK